MNELAEIVFGSRAGCRRYRLDDEKQVLEPAGGSAIGECVPVARVPDGLLVAQGNRLQLLDRELEVRREFRVEGMASVATSDSGAALVGAEGIVIALDSELVEVGRVEVPTPMPKSLHDIVWRGSRAWVLDNIMYPVYVFILEVADLGAIRVVATGEIEAIYPHLEHQWVNESDGRWFVVQSSSHQGGSYQSLHVLSADTADRAGREQLLWARRWHGMLMEGDDVPDAPPPGEMPPGNGPVRLRFAEETAYESFGIRICGIGQSESPVAAVRDVTGTAFVGEIMYRWHLPELGRRVRSAAPPGLSSATLSVAGGIVACLWTEPGAFDGPTPWSGDREPRGAWLTVVRRSSAWEPLYDGPAPEHRASVVVW